MVEGHSSLNILIYMEAVRATEFRLLNYPFLMIHFEQRRILILRNI